MNQNNFYNMNNELKEKIVDYLLNNKSIIMISSFYEALILSFLKFVNEKRNENKN